MTLRVVLPIPHHAPTQQPMLPLTVMRPTMMRNNAFGNDNRKGNDDEDEASSSSHDEEHASASPEKEDEPVIAKKETSTVVVLKLVVALVLVVSTIGAAIGIYRYARANEQQKFEARFKTDSKKVLEAIASSFQKTLIAFDSLSATLVSYAESSNSTWPYVTIPHFAVRAAKMLSNSNLLYVSVLPLVKPQDRVAWEDYSMINDYWVNETMDLQAEWSGYYGPVETNWTAGPTSDGFNVLPYNLSRDYLPTWQTFPSVPAANVYNYDWLAVSNTDVLRSSLKSHRASVSEAYLLPTAEDETTDAEAVLWADLYKQYIPDPSKAFEPVSDFYYPVINDLTKINVAGAKDYDAAENELVALLASPFYWRSMIEGNLPSDNKGIVIVFESPCVSSFTYEINGTLVNYKGVGDHHDHAYNHLVQTSTLSDLHIASTNPTYSGAPMDSELCPITMKLYPSDLMKEDFMTQDPRNVTMGAVGIFLFTTLIFVIYDCSVERRQRVVLTTATQSTAIVSSLFPSQVRDQLYPATTGSPEPTKGSMQAFLNESQDQTTNYKKPIGAPIADLYKETTVFFADIAGFTAWSSTRRPTDVFYLLESLYGAFDEIALRRGVFKIETIGDSYVAVVGLPTPRKHHALVMARFARDCMDAMNEIMRDLEQSLGEGTQDLAMRVGLNSGETTAGVLRGAKARFQLFGDTVNTAARMESNGERNRIQVSQATADLIIDAGKGHWLTTRRDKIVAKGKGEMQTYWCDPTTNSSNDTEENAVDTDETAAAPDSVGASGIPGATRVTGSVRETHDMVHNVAPSSNTGDADGAVSDSANGAQDVALAAAPNAKADSHAFRFL